MKPVPSATALRKRSGGESRATVLSFAQALKEKGRAVARKSAIIIAGARRKSRRKKAKGQRAKKSKANPT